MKEARIEIRIKNNILYKAIYSKYNNIMKFCKDHQLSYPTILSLINLKLNPYRKSDGFLTKPAMALSEILNIMPDILFPEELYKVKTNMLIIESEISLIPQNEQFLISKLYPEKKIINKELKKEIMEVLNSLLSMEKEIIIKLFFEDKSIEKVAKEYNITKEKIRQIKAKALRRLRHPSRMGGLKVYMDYND